MPNAAYFAVDGTITPLTTMFELLLFDAAKNDRIDDGLAFLMNLQKMVAAGSLRQVTNRKYYSWWAGRAVNDVESLGDEWFATARDVHGPDLVYPQVWQRLREHELLGDHIVLVSGSFAPALRPLADLVGAHEVLASEPDIADGLYTGTIASPMIGSYKATAVKRHAKQRGLNLQFCTAYGDEDFDAAFMALTGNPTSVGPPESSFVSATRKLGWSQLSITT